MSKFLEEQKKKLAKEKEELEQELKGFARRDSRIKGNWQTKFPDFGIRTADSDEETDQIEEYGATLPVEYALEIKLDKVNKALERLNGKDYGICQVCRKKIEIKRLKVYPEAETCTKCTKS